MDPFASPQPLEVVEKYLGGSAAKTHGPMNYLDIREIHENSFYGRLVTEWAGALKNLGDALEKAKLAAKKDESITVGTLGLYLVDLWPRMSIVGADENEESGIIQVNLYPEPRGKRGLKGGTKVLKGSTYDSAEGDAYKAAWEMVRALNAASSYVPAVELNGYSDRARKRGICDCGDAI